MTVREPTLAATCDPSNCLVENVADAMQREPALGAVKIDRARHAISIATLGEPRDPNLERSLSARIELLQQTTPRCQLLEGDADCQTCPSSGAPALRGSLVIHNEGATTTIARPTCLTAPRLWKWRDLPWPRLVPRHVMLPDEGEHDREWKQQIVAAALCGAFGLTGYFLRENAWATMAFVCAYIAGAWFTVHEVWERLQQRTLDVHFLMLVVALGSASIGAWGEGSMLLFLFSFSGALEHYAMGRTQREINSLFKTAPKTAVALVDGQEVQTPVEQLTRGTRLRIRPGEQFPVDAEVVKGETASDESNLTGEATPVAKRIGDSVLAGTLNMWGAVEVVVLRRAQESALQKIIHLIKEAQHLKAPAQRFTDKFGTGYTYAILGLSAAMFFVWWLGFRHAPFVSSDGDRSAFYRAMTLLVVSSPCALVLSIPSAVLAAIAWAARRGILFRGGAAVEKLAEIDLVAMDKTGTLTTGELRVDRVESFPSGREKEIEQLAYSLELLSTHPLARAVARFGKQRQITAVAADEFESVTGLGLRARVQGRIVTLGRREWVLEQCQRGPDSDVLPAAPGSSEVWIGSEGLLGRVVLRDDVRPQARHVVEELRRRGLRCIVLTGDRKAAGDSLKEQLGLDDVRSALKPEQKVSIIHGLTTEQHRVAMIGDGVNDAPSLAAADVGVAMGARGSDAALEQAEVVLMHDRLENFLTAFELSRRARRIIRQNLVISLGTVVVLVGCALAGSIPLTVGVFGHEGSTVVVVINSLRLLFRRA